MFKNINCRICQKEFRKKKSTSKYCSNECYYIGLKEMWRGTAYRENMVARHKGQNKGKKWPKWFGQRISRGLTGKKLSKEHRKKLSDSHVGKKQPWKAGSNHWNWKNGATEKNAALRNSLEYKEWRRKVYLRDNFTCQECGSKRNLNADHIKPFSLFPDLRFEVSNGRILCLNCHKKTDTWGWKIQKYESISC